MQLNNNSNNISNNSNNSNNNNNNSFFSKISNSIQAKKQLLSSSPRSPIISQAFSSSTSSTSTTSTSFQQKQQQQQSTLSSPIQISITKNHDDENKLNKNIKRKQHQKQRKTNHQNLQPSSFSSTSTLSSSLSSNASTSPSLSTSLLLQSSSLSSSLIHNFYSEIESTLSSSLSSNDDHFSTTTRTAAVAAKKFSTGAKNHTKNQSTKKNDTKNSNAFFAPSSVPSSSTSSSTTSSLLTRFLHQKQTHSDELKNNSPKNNSPKNQQEKKQAVDFLSSDDDDNQEEDGGENQSEKYKTSRSLPVTSHFQQARQKQQQEKQQEKSKKINWLFNKRVSSSDEDDTDSDSDDSNSDNDDSETSSDDEEEESTSNTNTNNSTNNSNSEQNSNSSTTTKMDDNEHEQEEESDESLSSSRLPSPSSAAVSMLGALVTNNVNLLSSSSSHASQPLSPLTPSLSTSSLSSSSTTTNSTSSSSSSTISAEPLNNNDGTAASVVDKKEVLLVFLMQHICRQVTPDPNYFKSMVNQLLDYGFISDRRYVDLQFLKAVCKDFMVDVISNWPTFIDTSTYRSNHHLDHGKNGENNNLNNGGGGTSCLRRSESVGSFLSGLNNTNYDKCASSYGNAHGGGVNHHHHHHHKNPIVAVYSDLPIFDSMFYTTSRYKQDWGKKTKLGKGAFGSVFRSKHRIDGHEYAIKRIKFFFRNRAELEATYAKVLREVKLLASLDHPNIVRYNQAWFEPSWKDPDYNDQNEDENGDGDDSENDDEDDGGYDSDDEGLSDVDSKQVSDDDDGSTVDSRGTTSRSFEPLHANNSHLSLQRFNQYNHHNHHHSSLLSVDNVAVGGVQFSFDEEVVVDDLSTLSRSSSVHSIQSSSIESSSSSSLLKHRSVAIQYEEYSLDGINGDHRNESSDGSDDDDQSHDGDHNDDEYDEIDLVQLPENYNHHVHNVVYNDYQSPFIAPSPQDMSYLEFAIKQKQQAVAAVGRDGKNRPVHNAGSTGRSALIPNKQQTVAATAAAPAAPTTTTTTSHKKNNKGAVQASNSDDKPGVVDIPIQQAVKNLLAEMFNEKKNKFEMFLFIQMQLCQQNTLEDFMWSKDRVQESNVDYGKCMNYFKQIVEGVTYIHTKHLIHRDLKPKNIFITGEDIIKIGDFGLAKSVKDNLVHTKSASTSSTTHHHHHHHGHHGVNRCDDGTGHGHGNRQVVHRARSPQTNSSSDHTSGVGTFFYAAPEQYGSSVYDEKADVFSLGIILFEMLHPFATKSERAHVLNGVRCGKIPENKRERYPEEMDLVRRCVDPSPTARPTAREVLTITKGILLRKQKRNLNGEKTYAHLNSSNSSTPSPVDEQQPSSSFASSLSSSSVTATATATTVTNSVEKLSSSLEDDRVRLLLQQKDDEILQLRAELERLRNSMTK